MKPPKPPAQSRQQLQEFSGVFRRFQEISGCGLSVRSARSAEMETVRVNQGRATSNVVFMQQLTHSPHPSLC